MNNLTQINMIVGLGNPGSEYDKTRHNVGFMVIDQLLNSFSNRFTENHKYTSSYWSGRFKGKKLLLQKPLTFMNASGKSVAPLLRANNLLAENVLLVYDDMDLPLGKIRLRKKGSSGGHNGIESVITELGATSFPRLRVGIGRGNPHEQIDHVLSPFTASELPLANDIIELAAESVKQILSAGLERVMNKINGIELNKKADTV
jgi:PTH1 family peptidyl-tRNA hydrolase